MADSACSALTVVLARRADEQAVLRRDVGGNGLRPDAVAALPEMHGAHDVDGRGTVDPTGEIAGVAGGQIVAARQDGHARTRRRRAIQHEVRQAAARVAGDDEIAGQDFDVFERGRDEPHAACEPRPCLRQSGVQLPGRCGHRLVDCERLRRRVVEKDQDLGKQAVAGAQIDDAAAAEQPAHAPRGLPRFVQFFARQAAGVADGARHAMKERRARKAIQIAIGEPAA